MSKWDAVAAIGQAAQGAGVFAGAIGSIKLKQERLAQAAAERQADRDWRVKYDADQRELRKADEAARLADQRAYSEGQRDEQRAYNERRESEKAATKEQHGALEDGMARIDEELDRKRERQKDVEDLVPDAKYSTTSSKDKMTEGDKRLAMRAEMGGRYLDKMIKIMGLGDPDKEGYDPTTLSALFEKVGNKFDLTRGFTSEASQFFDVAGEGMVAGILRTDTGAAAPEPEQVRYVRRLIPGVGESKHVVYWKMQTLEHTFAAMAAAAERGATPEGIRDAAIMAAMEFEMDNPRPAAGSRRRKGPNSMGDSVLSTPTDDILKGYGL